MDLLPFNSKVIRTLLDLNFCFWYPQQRPDVLVSWNVALFPFTSPNAPNILISSPRKYISTEIQVNSSKWGEKNFQWTENRTKIPFNHALPWNVHVFCYIISIVQDDYIFGLGQGYVSQNILLCRNLSKTASTEWTLLEC